MSLHRRTHFLLLLPAAISGAIYLMTMSPGVVGYDSAELITGAYSLGIVHPTGYPLYLLIAKLFTLVPIRTVAFRVNLVSVFFGVLAVYLTARWLYSHSRSMVAAWVGALSLAVSYGMWSMATVAEVYTLQVALILAVLITMSLWFYYGADRWLWALSFCFGLSLTNHVTSALFLPSLVLLIVSKIGLQATLKKAPVMAAAAILPLLVYLYLPLRYLADPPLNYVKSYYGIDLTTPSGLFWMISGQAYGFFSFGYDLQGYLLELWDSMLLLTKNFTLLGILLGSIGLISILKRGTREGHALLLAFLLNLFFFSGYAVSDKDTMFLPTFAIWSLWIGIGVYTIGSWVAEDSPLKVMERPIALKIFATALAVSLCLIGISNLRWLDKSANFGPDLYARRVLSTLPEDAFVIGGWSSAVILEYYQHVEGLRPDIEIFNRSRYEVALYYDLWKRGVNHIEAVDQIQAIEEGIISAFAAERDVFDADYNPYLARYYEYLPVGQVFQLIPRTEG